MQEKSGDLSRPWSRFTPLVRSLIAVPAVVITCGCSPAELGPVLIGNLPPTIEFTHAPINSTADDPAFYAYRVFWSAHDPDGRVDHVEYCVDPTPQDSLWVRSDRSEELIMFRAEEPEPGTSPVPRALSPHVLAIRAVDHQGARSPVRTRAFYSWTTAPSVQIVAPVPSRLLQKPIVPSVTIHWQGSDPDGQRTQRPVHYRHVLLNLLQSGNMVFLSDPDSLRRRDAPRGFADWDSSGAESTFVRFSRLTPGDQFLFAVVAFDEAGAYSPVFSLNENMLQMFVTLAGTMGPKIRIFNSVLDYTYDSGGYTTDPARWVRMEAASGEPLRFEWVGLPDEGATIADYRWAVDIASVSDNTPRSDELRDYRHWSRRSPLTTSCLLEGLSVGAHLLYIEAADNNGFPSLGIVEIQVVEARFDREVLIVDDTRRELDKFLQADVLDTYKQEWPSATELDTFLFARGGVPWRATQEPLSGETSVPGLFAGYSFDTLGTRLGLEVPSHGVKFSTLTQYRQVVWVVDVTAATYLDIMGARPMSVLAYMCSPSGVNTLGAYLRAGGRVWLCGGGAVTSSIDAFNEERNDLPLDRVYSDVGGELVPGRLLWDAAHWRSSVSAKSPLVTLARSPRAEQIADAPWSHTDYWTAAEVRAPDYRRLPAEFRLRAPELDRLPPTRTARQASSFYSSSTTVEYLFEQNHIVEDVDLSDEGVSMQATLDTVIEARSIALLRNPAPVMTWYHGANVNRFVTTGFAPWALTRADAIAITDFVLQDLWGLSRAPVDRGGSVRPDARAPVTRSRHARTASSQRSPVDPRAAPR